MLSGQTKAPNLNLGCFKPSRQSGASTMSCPHPNILKIWESRSHSEVNEGHSSNMVWNPIGCRKTSSCSLAVKRDGLSPVQKLFVQDSLPGYECSFAAEWQRSTEEANAKEKAHSVLVKQYYNKHAMFFQMI